VMLWTSGPLARSSSWALAAPAISIDGLGISRLPFLFGQPVG
jgi:hypothetical protein